MPEHTDIDTELANLKEGETLVAVWPEKEKPTGYFIFIHCEVAGGDRDGS